MVRIAAPPAVMMAVLISTTLVAATGVPAPPAPPLFGVPGLTITATGVWSGVLMFAGWLLNEWRQTRRLSAEDRQARREGYAKQVEGLQLENRNLRDDLMTAERRHDDYRRACQSETDQLRAEIRSLEDMVTGLKRRLDSQASALGRAVLGGDTDVLPALHKIKGVGEQ